MRQCGNSLGFKPDFLGAYGRSYEIRLDPNEEEKQILNDPGIDFTARLIIQDKNRKISELVSELRAKEMEKKEKKDGHSFMK